MRQYATSDFIGMPFGQPQHLDEADVLIARHLGGMDEVRDSVEAFAIALLIGVGQERYNSEVLQRVMGADDGAQERVPFIDAQGHSDVRRLAGGALGYLAEKGTKAGSDMVDLVARRDDVAREMLTWLTIAMLRVETLGLLPPTPRSTTTSDQATTSSPGRVGDSWPEQIPGDLPEQVANDLEGTRRRARMTSAADYARIVESFRRDYESGRLSEVWAGRCDYGVSVGADAMSESDWFWFNAYPALAGLELQKPTGYPLDNFCGLADAATDYNDRTQVAATRRINGRYFG